MIRFALHTDHKSLHDKKAELNGQRCRCLCFSSIGICVCFSDQQYIMAFESVAVLLIVDQYLSNRSLLHRHIVKKHDILEYGCTQHL